MSSKLATQVGLVLALFSSTSVLSAQEPPNVLDLPRIMRDQTVDRVRGVQLIRAGKRQEALEVFTRSVERVPHDPFAHYNLACAHALLDQPGPALESLQKAIECGFRAREVLEMEADFDSLRGLPEFGELLAACNTPPPKEAPGWKYSINVAKADDGILTLQPDNMVWNQAGGILQVFADLSKAGKGKRISEGQDAVGKLLRRWFAAGSAAGNLGDLYDNHDRGHSVLAPSFPQLTRIEYGGAIKERHLDNLDNGLQRHFIYTHAQMSSGKAAANGTSANVADKILKVERAVVLGNSSTALTGSALWRSMPRLALTSPGGAELLLQHYLNDHLYVYPEHRDHDPGHDAEKGWGDVFFANTPYYIISQGSSGTDQPFLHALAATLAAFPKDVKDHLRAAGLVSPTLQMIFRRCNRQVQSDEDYLSGIAHPTVFDGAQIDALRMVQMAHSLKLTQVPPLVALKIESEHASDPHKDYFDAVPSEQLLTTPFAIARAGYSTQYWREMQVSATAHPDAKGSSLKFHWVILRGDPDRIEIKSVEGQPHSRIIRVAYHQRRPVGPDSSIESNRVDIGVFAFNGHHYSAPSFLSFYFPDNEVREYDAEHRILSVDYVKAADNYADPAIIPKRDWRDEYHYNSDDALTGWTRIRSDQREEFNAAGELLVASDDAKASAKARPVRYERISNPDGTQVVKQVAVEADP